jgi:hypothetical protein
VLRKHCISVKKISHRAGTLHRAIHLGYYIE